MPFVEGGDEDSVLFFFFSVGRGGSIGADGADAADDEDVLCLKSLLPLCFCWSSFFSATE
jgi:hypothetical protein